MDEDATNRDQPSEFYAVSRTGIVLLKQANLYEEVSIWSSMYAQMERNETIKQIENFDKRPTPGWYDEVGSSTLLARDLANSVEDQSAEADGISILIAEDREEIRRLFQDWLSEEYEEVHAVKDGEKALNKLKSQDYEIVLLDRRMPNMEGDEVALEIAERDYDCMVAMVTATDPDFDVVNLPIADYLLKTVNKPSLLNSVNQLVSVYNNEEYRELFSINSKISVLQWNIAKEELEKSEEFAQLMTRYEKLRMNAQNPENMEKTPGE